MLLSAQMGLRAMVSLDDVNQAILGHVGLYHVATRQSIAQILPERTEPDKRLSGLVAAGYLRAHRGLTGNRSVYQLTKKGASVVGVSPARARRPGGQSLRKNLGVLLFCRTPGKERYRVEVDELQAVIGSDLPDGAYCVVRTKDKVMSVACYVPGPETPVATVLRHLNRTFHQLKRLPSVAQAIRDLRFGIAVIVDVPTRRKSIMDAVRTKQAGESAPLIRRIRVWVEHVPELGAVLGTVSPRLGRTARGASGTLFDLTGQGLTHQSEEARVTKRTTSRSAKKGTKRGTSDNQTATLSEP